jgi:dolichol-phosphate mannosyltransferase
MKQDDVMLSRSSESRAGFSLVVPVFNEEENIPLLETELPKALERTGLAWELVLVDDGSSDRTLELLTAWARREPRLVVVELSRNFGHQSAVLSGLSVSTGEFIGIIDGDLQDPPELLPDMLAIVQDRADVVYGVRRKRKEGLLLKSAYWLAYRIINTIADRPIPLDSGDFCLMRRCVLDELLRLGEQRLFLRGLRSWVGFRQVALAYDRSARARGEPKYGLKDLWRLLRDGVYGFTTLPMRVMRWLGAVVMCLCLLYTVFLLGSLLAGSPAPRGFASLILAICFFGGANLLAFGIVGEYVARIYDETRGRPRFIVRHIHRIQPETP